MQQHSIIIYEGRGAQKHEIKFRKSVKEWIRKNPELSVEYSDKRTRNSTKSRQPNKTITYCNYCNEAIVHNVNIKRKYHMDCWYKCCGGNRKGSGRGKCGWYKNYWCDSSYELAWVIYHLDKGISFSRNIKGFSYEYNKKRYTYFPDFIMDGKYIEIKGFMTDKDLAKIQQFPHDLIVLNSDSLNDIFKYVKQTYGNHFIELYESNPHRIKNNYCKVCNAPCFKIYCSRVCSMKGNRKN